MSQTELVIEGQRVRLGKRIGKGGEGEVFLLENTPDRLVKVYTVKVDGLREQKLAAMIQAGLARRTDLVAFPLQVARGPDGKFRGFVMKFVRERQPLHELYSVKSRKINFPKADYRFLVRSAANVARAIAAVHETGCVIGDINHSGVLISRRAEAALIDADSFQFSAGSRRFPCLVGVPEFTPPELQGKSLHGIERTANHDGFGLAIAIFHLLFMGRHAFSGRYGGRGEMPIEKAIGEYRFAYSRQRSTGMRPPPGICTLDDFPEPVAAAFERAFGPGGAPRPTAREWVGLLADLEKSLVHCKSNSLHYYPQAAKDCPWCRMESVTIGMMLFVPPAIAFTPTPAVDPGAAAFDLDALWRAVDAIRIPQPQSFTPSLPAAQMGPSAEALREKAAAEKYKREAAAAAARLQQERAAAENLAREKAAKDKVKFRALGVAVLVGAVGLFFLAPQAWIVCGALGAWAMGLLTKEPTPQPVVLTSATTPTTNKSDTDWKARYRAAEEKWQDALEAWRARNGVDALINMKAELEAAREGYRTLVRNKAWRIQTFEGERRAKQLEDFLDRFLIARTKIRNVGPTRLATLASFGIESAADISEQGVGQLPGFGPSITGDLMAWRRSIERRFIFNRNLNQTEQQALQKIEAEFAADESKLRRQLSAGPTDMKRLSDAIQVRVRTQDPVLVRAFTYRAQCEADLAFFGLARPHVPLRPSKRNQHTAPAAPAWPPPVTPPRYPFPLPAPLPAPTRGTANVTCPTCGAAMVQRVARRGPRRGKPFWGCSQYPGCHGTRPI